MRINHNISAMNAHRMLTLNNTNVAKSLEKLSSGLRINRAGDDAAGLAISEKMRGQIRGLDMAVKNAQDGISLIQTAEGALNETHAILQRMRELAVQAANDTNTAADRQQLQKEIDQLAQELGRIGKTTEFNTQKLLDGTFNGIFHIGANQNQNLSLSINDMRGFALGMAGDVTYTGQVTGTRADGTDNTQDIADGTYTVSFNSTSNQYELKDSSDTVVATSTDGGLTYTAATGGDTITFTEAVTNGTVTVSGTSVTTNVTSTTTTTVTNEGLDAGVYTYDATTQELKNASGEVVGKFDTTSKAFVDVNDPTKTLFTVGADLTSNTTFTIGGVDISTQTAANAAITAIDNAIEKVSTERAKLGAYQNRLEHTINNLGTASENLSAAESRIRDTDMAKEMMEFTKNSILAQAAQAMLAQANQVPQGVLQLLR